MYICTYIYICFFFWGGLNGHVIGAQKPGFLHGVAALFMVRSFEGVPWHDIGYKMYEALKMNHMRSMLALVEIAPG